MYGVILKYYTVYHTVAYLQVHNYCTTQNLGYWAVLKLALLTSCNANRT